MKIYKRYVECLGISGKITAITKVNIKGVQ